MLVITSFVRIPKAIMETLFISCAHVLVADFVSTVFQGRVLSEISPLIHHVFDQTIAQLGVSLEPSLLLPSAPIVFGVKR